MIDCVHSVNFGFQGNDNYVGIAARDTANALRVFVNAARGVAATSSDKQEQNLIIDGAREVIAQSNMLLEVALKWKKMVVVVVVVLRDMIAWKFWALQHLPRMVNH